jgi:hypothetical protein
MRTYRIRKVAPPSTAGERQGGFRTRLEALDDEEGIVLATCAFSGRAALCALEIAAADGTRWTTRPSRRVMPTAWTVIAEGRPMIQLSVSFWRSFVNPLRRASLRVSGSSGTELFRVSDERKGRADRLFGAGPIEWMFMRDGQSIGKLRPLSRPERKDVGRVRRFLSGLGNDVGVVSFGDEHVLPAPAALALAAIHADLTDPS